METTSWKVGMCTSVNDEVRLRVQVGYSLHHQVQGGKREITVIVTIVTCLALDKEWSRESNH